jgi:hypothetical protein
VTARTRAELDERLARILADVLVADMRAEDAQRDANRERQQRPPLANDRPHRHEAGHPDDDRARA